MGPHMLAFFWEHKTKSSQTVSRRFSKGAEKATGNTRSYESGQKACRWGEARLSYMHEKRNEQGLIDKILPVRFGISQVSRDQREYPFVLTREKGGGDTG